MSGRGDVRVFTGQDGVRSSAQDALHGSREGIVGEWLGCASVDPGLAVPPDAKVAVQARYLTTFGRLKAGQETPDDGQEWRQVTATLYFRNEGPPDDPYDVGLAIARVLDRLEAALQRDPTMGGKVSRARWRGTDGSAPTEPPDAPDGYPNAVEVYVAVTA